MVLLVGIVARPRREVAPAHALEPVTGAEVEVVGAGGLEVEAGLAGHVDHVAAHAARERADVVRPVLRAGVEPARVPERLQLALAAVHLQPGEAALAHAAEGAQRADGNDLGGQVVEAAAGRRPGSCRSRRWRPCRRAAPRGCGSAGKTATPCRRGRRPRPWSTCRPGRTRGWCGRRACPPCPPAETAP